MGMNVLQAANLGLRFLIEICALVIIGYWGFQTGQNWAGKGLLGIILPLFVAFVWGMMLSPKAKIHLLKPFHLLLEIIILGAPILLLLSLENVDATVIYGSLNIVNMILLFAWKAE
ncbi:hypothetical protein CFK37_06755 [Virgibacillus phasianinus]|uniref:DUF2568 domain-containing protein n=1 Tax=Virgibacillus phasianinus TaxID=2017483 RepID=A0A220U1C1_9BACI|nr:YrdB family protein [Virgibacillus phasianinus]ASK61880.1 hypothetical protein CFK37_06755 [Virgibacillus phasianinus]